MRLRATMSVEQFLQAFSTVEEYFGGEEVTRGNWMPPGPCVGVCRKSDGAHLIVPATAIRSAAEVSEIRSRAAEAIAAAGGDGIDNRRLAKRLGVEPHELGKIVAGIPGIATDWKAIPNNPATINVANYRKKTQ